MYHTKQRSSHSSRKGNHLPASAVVWSMVVKQRYVEWGPDVGDLSIPGDIQEGGGQAEVERYIEVCQVVKGEVCSIHR